MKLINSRFRIIGVTNQGEVDESYIVKDLQHKEEIKYLTIYNIGRDKKAIDYFTNEFKTLSNIRHKSLIELEKFDIIESINLKKPNDLMYYVINKYVESTKLNDVKENIDLKSILKIILQLMHVMDYLHYRGYIYKHLSPTNVYITNDYAIKIKDLASIYRDFTFSYHNYLTELFIAPENFHNNESITKYADYYSIGMIMKYLLFKGLNIEDVNKASFKDEFNLTDSQKIFLINTIKNLTHKDSNFRNMSLANHSKNIIAIFGLDFDHDLVKERDGLILNTNIIGRDKEIQVLHDIANSLTKGNKKFDEVIISGRSGSGKTKLIEEMAFRFALMNKTVLYLKGRTDLITGGLSIYTLLKASFKYAPNELINKYNKDFEKILIHNSDDDIKYDDLRNKTPQEKYQIFHRLTLYFDDLSIDRPIYILIDDIHLSNDDFIKFIHYMMSRLENKKVFIISTVIDASLVHNKAILRYLETKIDQVSVTHMELSNLTEADTGKLIKTILGMNFIPVKFTSYIYKESLGNPNYIYYIIKDLYSREELYMSKQGVWETREKDFSKIKISIDYNHAINGQIAHIGQDKYLVLEIIALSKAIITRDILKGVLALDGEDIDSIIKYLVESRIIDDNIVANMESLSIYSNELKRIIYSRISSDDKTKLHKQAADCITKLYKDNYEFIIEELMHHLINSNQVDYAFDIVFNEAVGQSNKYSSYSILLWEHAYNLVKNTDHDQRLNILNSLIEIYDMKGFIELKSAYISEMYDIALEKGNLDYLIKAKYYDTEMLLNTNQIDAAENMILEMEDILNKNEGLWDGQILLLMSKANMEFDKNSFDVIEDYLTKAINISKENNILKYLGNLYNLYGVYYYLTGMPEEAIDFFNKSIKAYEEDNNIIEEYKPINNIGNIYLNVYSMYDRALEYFKTGYDMATEYGHAKASTIFTSNMGDIYYRSLQLDDALRYLGISRDISNEIEDFRGTILSNLSLGLIYLRTEKYDKANEVYEFIEEINKEEPLLDSEILTAYYTFMGEYFMHYGKLEDALKYFSLLSDITKEYRNRDYLYAESIIFIIKGFDHSDYDKDKLVNIINEYQTNEMNNIELEICLVFALISVKYNDIDYAKKILDIYSKYCQNKNINLRGFSDSLNAILNPSINKLLALESYQDSKMYRDYEFYINTILAREWAKFKNYKRAIRSIIKAMDNVFKRAETINDKGLKYSFLSRRNVDGLKGDLCEYIERTFNKKIDYINLRDSYEKHIRYNDMIYILGQLEPAEYREIMNVDNRYQDIDSVEELINEFTDDYQYNLNLILSYLAYKTLASKGYILMYNEDENTYKVLSSLFEDDTNLPRMNLLSQSNRSPLGILINKNLKNMEGSKYIELISEDIVSIMCVPLTNSRNNMVEIERRKKSTISKFGNFSLPNSKTEIYIYFESDSYFNKFEYDKLILIKQLASLILLNIENKYLKDNTIVDKLTGVMTRKYFETQIDRIIETYNKYHGNFSLLMIDTDNFTGLNDKYGHLIGDDALSMLGAKLIESVRSTDLVARYGGDEFIIILFDTNIEEGYDIAEKIRKKVLEVKDPNIKREISVSIGLSQYPDHGHRKKELIKKADQALYFAKEKNGKNSTVTWTIDMDEGINNPNKLTGILTGNTSKDNINISTIVYTADLIEGKASKSEKIAEFTNRILDVLEAQFSTFIEFKGGDLENAYLYETKIQNIPEWVKTPKLNLEVIERVIKKKKGEFLIDWDNSTAQYALSDEPIWQSIMVLPVIENGLVLGIIYLSVPLKEKEFTTEDYNLGNLLVNIFAGALNSY